ncbi:MAG: Adenine phosphoribosyltransferase [Pelosinus sp.]|jgi:adenine phosphoribosyltransferase|nr:Adenine phosphoribosyltransferase [Pelosinus sp.]
MNFKESIRVVEDFPEKGIRFKDITTLLKDGNSFHQAIDALSEPFKGKDIELVVGPEARGFVIGAPVAYALGAGFVPVRKPGKLPAETLKHEYSLEYGKDSLEIHKDAITPGQKILIVDDLLATGGTVQATISMVEALGGIVVGLVFLIELSYLDGRKNLMNYNIMSLLKY